MATFHFDLVSPEELLLSGEVEQVDIPGMEGDFGVLAGHAPFVTTLRPGILTIKRNGTEQKVVIFGGFAEVSPTGLTVLADVATAVEDFDKAELTAQIKKTEEKVAKLEKADDSSVLDREISRLDHFKSLDYHLTGTALH